MTGRSDATGIVDHGFCSMMTGPGTMDEPENRINSADDHYCFGCGRLNPSGLHLHFYPLESGDGVWAPFTPAREQEGYMGMVHGGIISTLLDEAMAWSLYRQNIWAVTGRMSLAFKQPVEVGVETRVIGRLITNRGRLLDVRGELIRESDGVVLAEAEALFVRVPTAQAESWKDRYLPATS
jgi:acyl-coenzyme A thioesterase PaaI-like protein